MRTPVSPFATLGLRHQPGSESMSSFFVPFADDSEQAERAAIHTHLRGGLSATPILVSPDDMSGRVYFDDFPAHT